MQAAAETARTALRRAETADVALAAAQAEAAAVGAERASERQVRGCTCILWLDVMIGVVVDIMSVHCVLRRAGPSVWRSWRRRWRPRAST